MTPRLYLFYGNDEAAIAQALASLPSRMGDPANAEMNMSKFDGPPLNLDEIRSAAFAMPFLTEKRLVLVSGATASFKSKEAQSEFLAFLEQVPESTRFVMAENNLQGEEKDKRDKSAAWLKKWMQSAGESAYVKRYALPEGGAMIPHLQKKAQELGGELVGPAAIALSELIGQDTRAATQEIEKLLAYVNYARPITEQDVQACALEIGEHGDYFGLMDALAAGPGPKALSLLRRLQSERNSIQLFSNLVSQFGLLLQAKDIMEAGGGPDEIAAQARDDRNRKLHPYRAKKLAAQSRSFEAAQLAQIYQKLADYDWQIKTGQLDANLAMDLIVSAVSA